jgi:H+/Cl- antiporter ClcA
MRRIHNVTFGCVILGVIFALFAYGVATQDHMTFWLENHQWHYGRESHPFLFWVVTLTFGGIGIVFWGLAWYLHFRRRI